MWTSKCVNSKRRFELLFWNCDEQLAYWERCWCIPQCLCRFINNLPFKSDEIAHIAFPVERYNKPKLTGICIDACMHVNDNSSFGAAFTVNGATLRCMNPTCMYIIKAYILNLHRVYLFNWIISVCEFTIALCFIMILKGVWWIMQPWKMV